MNHVLTGVVVALALLGCWHLLVVAWADVRRVLERRRPAVPAVPVRRVWRVEVMFETGAPLVWFTDLGPAAIQGKLPELGPFGGRCVVGYGWEPAEGVRL